MKVLEARNVHQALPFGLRLLQAHGIQRESRAGTVLQAPWPVTTVYERPEERVLFWKERDANPFFHLYEALWMLAGRNDLKPLLRYASKFGDFSDDGKTLHGAYGYRWRRHFHDYTGDCPTDQLKVIIETLRRNPEDRRCVLQMWDPECDFGMVGRDFPCNTTATFQIDPDGRLSLTVFCRSNDIVWGAYGANAVHFSLLLEYMAVMIGVPMGVYRQVSVNWHGYVTTLKPLIELPQKIDAMVSGGSLAHECPYTTMRVSPVRLFGEPKDIDPLIKYLLGEADNGFPITRSDPAEPFWFSVFYAMLRAHAYYRVHNVERALETLAPFEGYDWAMAGRGWIQRRELYRELPK